MLSNGNHPTAALQHPALSLLPSTLFLMTAAHEGKRAGMLVTSVQACSGEPPLLCITLRKGHWIEPIIRDSRCFALCLVDPADRLITKKFGDTLRGKDPSDPFDCLPVERLATGAPVVKRSIAAFDCEVVRHLDIEVDHGLYVGLVRASRVYAPQAQPGGAAVTVHPPSLSA